MKLSFRLGMKKHTELFLYMQKKPLLFINANN